MNKKITIAQWNEFVKKNCDISYSLSICLAILELWEHKVKTEEEANKVLRQLSVVKGFSGAQAQMAISFALGGEPDGWLDKSMVEMSTSKTD